MGRTGKARERLETGRQAARPTSYPSGEVNDGSEGVPHRAPPQVETWG